MPKQSTRYPNIALCYEYEKARAALGHRCVIVLNYPFNCSIEGLDL